MPQTRSGPGLASLLVAVLCLQACHGASPSNQAEPRRSPNETSSVPTPSAVVRFGRASFHLPSPIQREVGIAAGSTVYLIGGLNDTGTSVSTVEQVDLSRGRVQVIGQVLHRFHDGAGAWIGNRLFVFGGGTGAGSDAVQSFSPSQRLAEVEGALPRTLSDLSTASVDGVTYLIGGYDGVAPQRTIYATTDGRHFHRACLLPQGLRYAAVATTGNTLVIAGGETSRGPTDAILAFDPSTGAITIVGHLPQPLGHASAFAAGGVVYVAGGVDGAGRTLRSVVAVDTASGRVSDAGRLPAPLSDAAALVLTGRAWLFGGLRGRAVSDVLVASIPPT